MRFDNHWLSAETLRFRRIPSPNHSERPDETDVSLIVIHNISLPPKQFGGPYISDFFQNCLDCDQHPFFQKIRNLKVSAHFLIRRDGELIQYVPVNRCAWHAGASQYQGRDRCNDFSVGIELEGADDIPYTEAQYQRLGELTQALLSAYPTLSPQRVVGHADIAPGRKTDPGPSFDWQRLKGTLGLPNE